MQVQTEHRPEPAENAGATDTPRIYVACLAAYNAGHLHGCWIDAIQDAEDIQDDINAMLKGSPIPDAEEYAIHDYENFANVRIHEFSGIDEVAQLAAFIDERGTLGAAVLAHCDNDLDRAEAAFDDYVGEHRSLADFAQELTEDTTEIPRSLAGYIDYEAMARDMEINGDVFTVETGFQQVHVFWSR